MAAQFGETFYARDDSPATPAQKQRLQKLTPDQITATELAGEPIIARLTKAPGNDAPIGGLKIVAAHGWFAARPSGTEDVLKVYAESYQSDRHLRHDSGTGPANSRGGPGNFVTTGRDGGRRRRRETQTRPNLRTTAMRATQQLHDLGQSIWLDNITRGMLMDGTLRRYIDEFSVTGLTSNPTIYDHAVKNSGDYDAAIRKGMIQGKSGEGLFFALALEDLTQAADAFRPIFDRSDGVDGWVSLEVSPKLAHDTAGTLAAAKDLHARAERPNLFIKIPGTSEGLPAIEEAIFAGIPVNVTLLFSREQYVAAAEAYLRGIERRIAAGLKPDVGSVASVFVSRWDTAVAGKVPEDLRNRLGIAVAMRTYKAYRDLLDSPRWQRAYNAGARPQRLLWASTGTKDPKASDVLYVKATGRPVHREHDARGHLEGARRPWRGRADPAGPRRGLRGRAGPVRQGRGRRRCPRRPAPGSKGPDSFVKSWQELLDCIAAKMRPFKKAG